MLFKKFKAWRDHVGLYINSKYQFNVIPELSFINDAFECIFVEIIFQKHKNLIIGCIYRAPNTDLDLYNIEMFNLLNKSQLRNNKNIFVMGDFNINLLNYKSNISTFTFLNTMISSGFLPTVNQPTRTTNTSASLIDNIFTNYNAAHCKVALIYSDVSDHFPIYLQCQPISKNKKFNIDELSV